MVKTIVIIALLLIVTSLGTALYYLYHDRGKSKRMVKALAIRVALSASLIVFLVVSYKLGGSASTACAEGDVNSRQ